MKKIICLVFTIILFTSLLKAQSKTVDISDCDLVKYGDVGKTYYLTSSLKNDLEKFSIVVPTDDGIKDTELSLSLYVKSIGETEDLCVDSSDESVWNFYSEFKRDDGSITKFHLATLVCMSKDSKTRYAICVGFYIDDVYNTPQETYEFLCNVRKIFKK